MRLVQLLPSLSIPCPHPRHSAHWHGRSTAFVRCSRLYTMSAKSSNIFGGKGAEELRQMPVGQCSRDTPLLPKEELSEKLAAIPAWKLIDDERKISRSFVAKNFLAALNFFNKVGELAEDANHHPDLHLTNYRDVQVDLSTHAIGGIAQVDLVLAAKIDALPTEYSPKWLRQQEEQLQKAN